MKQMVRQSSWLGAWRRLVPPSAPLPGPVPANLQKDAERRGLQYLLEHPADAEAEPDKVEPAPLRAPAREALPETVIAAQNGRAYRVPADLQRSEVHIRRVLVIGSCLSQGWVRENQECGAIFDYIVTNNFSPLPDRPPAALAEYDFQIVQIPLRSVMHENTYGHLPLTAAAFTELFGSVTGWLSQYLDIALAWNARHGLLTFVSNFMVPQQNPFGRLLPRNDLRNLVYFVEKLNEHLYGEIAKRSNVYLFDVDQIAATFGRRSMQDDAVWVMAHGGTLNDVEFEQDRARIVPTPAMSAHYPLLAEGESFFYKAAWTEIAGMFRTLRGSDQVKLVIFDLDDTLWRGVVAEEGQITPDLIEGWPVGLMEAACFLKSRGILLAICSKNDEARITALFDRIGGGRLKLSDFAAKRINWRPKHENINEILTEVHLTPHSAVFVDDNPVERAAIEASIPQIRTLGAHPYYLRRILLWSAETQVAVITDESVRRTEMVQAQIGRDKIGGGMQRDAFLRTLELRMCIREIRSVQDRHFARALELINKTNQFNSTGERRNVQACAALFGAGTVFLCFDVQDRFSEYGLVGVAVMRGGHISQFVMSCRVLGLGAEAAFLAYLAERAGGSGCEMMTADYVATELGGLARDFLQRNGFVEAGARWEVRIDAVPATPSHVEVVVEPALALPGVLTF
jgi:FkbH-like protein